MGLRLFPILHLALLLFNGLEAIEFSQFYLPPCCLIASAPLQHGVASAPTEQNGTVIEPAYPRNAVSGEDAEAEENSVYKLIVPLKFPTAQAATKALSESPPSPPNIPEEAPPSQPDLPKETVTTAIPTPLTSPGPKTVSDASSSPSDNVFNVFLYRELEKMRQNPKYSQQPSHLPHHIPVPYTEVLTTAQPPPTREDSVFDRIAKFGYTMSERLQQLSSTFQTIAATPPAPTHDSRNNGFISSLLQNSHGPYQMYRSLVKRQTSQQNQDQRVKMPALWIKNLRKALYQSLSSRSKASNNPTDGKLLWKNLRGAKLKFIDLASQQASDLPEEIYLPAGQGPIVSGIAAIPSDHSGQFEIRIPSELYTQDSHKAGSGEGSAVEDQCHCSLVNHGDTVLAYWSISRIISQDGQPALQYLVYPLPYHHNNHLPSPPQLIPLFTGGQNEFRPSPHDPLPGYYNNADKNHHKLPIVTDARHRKPKLHNEDPPLPGVPVTHQNGKYTEDFLSLYRDAINHHFHNIDSMKTPFGPTGVQEGNIEGFISQHFHPPGGSVPPLPQGQQHLPDIPFGGGYIEGPPTTIPGIATPINPSGGGNLYDHPKSIQDILTPFIPPSPPQQLGPVGHNPYQNGERLHQQVHNNNGNNGIYYEDDRKYQNPNVVPPPYNNGPGKRFPLNYRPQNSLGAYDDPYYARPGQGNKAYHGTRHESRRPSEKDLPKKQAYIKEYYADYKQGKTRKLAHRNGGNSLNDIDNPDGYILDFKK